ncbi:MAG: hypothetical protein NXI24_07145 [bacterium]|nr:hypothetical protein [bacterium]
MTDRNIPDTKKTAGALKKPNHRRSLSVGLRRIGLIALLLVAAAVQCTLGTNDCRKERDDAALCGLVALDTARLCTTDAIANNQSTEACQTPILGGLLLCPLSISEACE